ncbi:MAG: hypothetical protein U0174_07295 [Polyangiaceae bacterium]
MLKFRHAMCVALVSGAALIAGISFVPGCQKSPEKAQNEALVAEAEREAELTQAVVKGPEESRDRAEGIRPGESRDPVTQDANRVLREARTQAERAGDEQIMKLEQRISVLRGRLSMSHKPAAVRADLERKVDEAVAKVTRARATLENVSKAADPSSLSRERAQLEGELRALDTAISNLAKEI